MARSSHFNPGVTHMEKYASNNSSNNEAIAQDKLDDAQDKLEKKDNRREGSVQCLYGNG